MRSSKAIQIGTNKNTVKHLLTGMIVFPVLGSGVVRVSHFSKLKTCKSRTRRMKGLWCPMFRWDHRETATGKRSQNVTLTMYSIKLFEGVRHPEKLQ